MFKILIVEDSQDYRKALMSALSTKFPSVAISGVDDAEEAIEKFDDFKPDLILVDIRLPGMSGLQLTKEIKEDYPDVNIIIMTSYDMLEYRKQARQYQANDFINKNSTSLDEIINLVEKHIVLKHQENHTTPNASNSD